MADVSESEFEECLSIYRKAPKEHTVSVYEAYLDFKASGHTTRQAMKMALEMHGLWPVIHAMEGAVEYDEIMASQEVYKATQEG